MSRYSGKCDLYDYIAGQGGWFDKDGNPVRIGEGHGACYSDEMLDFKAFKKVTGGVLHQHKKVKVTECNQEDVVKHCSDLSIIEHKEVVLDKRCASGEKIKTTYTYMYWGKEYTLKELNKHGVWVTIDIHFDTLLDLIPYYPYIVCFANGGNVVISDQSFVIEERDDNIENGHFSEFWEVYQKGLQRHYIDIVLEYFNPVGREVEEDLTFFKECTQNGDRYIAYTLYPIDDNIEVEWLTSKVYWTTPKRVDDHIIEMSQADFEVYLGNKCRVHYAKAKDKHNLRLS